MERQTQSTVGLVLLAIAAASVYFVSSDSGTAIPYSFTRWIGGAIGATMLLVALLAVTKRRSAFSTVLVLGLASVFSAGTNITDMLSRQTQSKSAIKATEAILSGKTVESNQPFAKAIDSYNSRFVSAYLDYDALLTEAGFENALKPHVLSSVAEATSMRESLQKVRSAIPGLSARGDEAWVNFQADMNKIGTETAHDFLAGAMTNRERATDNFKKYFRIQNALLGAIVDIQTLSIEVGGISKEAGQYHLPDDESVTRFNTLVQKMQILAAEEEEWRQHQDQMIEEAQKQVSEARKIVGG